VKGQIMNIDRMVLAFAGCVVLTGLALGAWANPYWYLLSAFAGLNMLQASFTGFCPAAILFAKLGVNPGPAFR
jgi:Inner membrane protein YgaP-like, transmembrane domain